MTGAYLSILAAASLAVTAPVSAAKLPDTWDGLYKVKAKHLLGVYLLPNADFRGYAKVILDPTQVAFRKDWQRQQNDDASVSGRRVSDTDARDILDAAQGGFEKRLREAYQHAGYQIVTAAGSDVLRVSTAVVNLDVAAPDITTAGRTLEFTPDAGGATLVVEARDSVSGQLLGRGVDSQSANDLGPYLRNRATNSAAFDQLFSSWAKRSAEGLTELKALSPIDTNAQPLSK